METIETKITNRLGANINKRIDNTFDGASWSMAGGVAIDTHTFIGLGGGGGDIINRLSEIQVVIKKFFLAMAN